MKWYRINESDEKDFLDPWDDGYEDQPDEVKLGIKNKTDDEDDAKEQPKIRNIGDKPLHYQEPKDKDLSNGGNDYYRLGKMMNILKNKGLMEDTSREVWMKIDDGFGDGVDGCTYKRLRAVVKGFEWKGALGCLTAEEFPRLEGADTKVDSFMRQVYNRATNQWGRIVKDLLVYMNPNDNSVYCCNGMTIEGNRLLLDFEWSDLGSYDKYEFKW